MAKHIRAKAQAKKDRAALQKLKSTGLYKGKLDLRRKPTKYQLGLISKYRDVVTGKAVVLKPKDPESYKSIFRVVGDKVIVPKRKGEKIQVGKSGAIVGERKVGGRKVKTRFRRVRPGTELPVMKKTTMLFVPFIRGRDAKGDPVLEWKRFPNRDMLTAFMQGYDYKNWADYVVEEDIENITDNIDQQLTAKLSAAKRKKIKFPDRQNKKRGHNATGRSR